jgi:hypothetical protein
VHAPRGGRDQCARRPDLIGVPAGIYPVPVGTFQNRASVTGDLVVTGAGAVPTIVSGGGTAWSSPSPRGDGDVPRSPSRTAVEATTCRKRGGIANRGTLTLLDVIVRGNEGGSASGG